MNNVAPVLLLHSWVLSTGKATERARRRVVARVRGQTEEASVWRSGFRHVQREPAPPFVRTRGDNGPAAGGGGGGGGEVRGWRREAGAT